MRLTTLLTGLVSLLSVTTAIPMASEAPTYTTSVEKSLISPSSSASASPTPSPNPYEAYTCPPGKFKSCCMSVQQTGKDIVKSLGELVPVLGGVQVSSAIAFQCKNMTEREVPDTCTGKGYNPMCCNTQNDGTSFNTCKPFEDVKRAYYSNQMKDVPESQADMIMDILT